MARTGISTSSAPLRIDADPVTTMARLRDRQGGRMVAVELITGQRAGKPEVSGLSTLGRGRMGVRGHRPGQVWRSLALGEDPLDRAIAALPRREDREGPSSGAGRCSPEPAGAEPASPARSRRPPTAAISSRRPITARRSRCRRWSRTTCSTPRRQGRLDRLALRPAAPARRFPNGLRVGSSSPASLRVARVGRPKS